MGFKVEGLGFNWGLGLGSRVKRLTTLLKGFTGLHRDSIRCGSCRAEASTFVAFWVRLQTPIPSFRDRP